MDASTYVYVSQLDIMAFVGASRPVMGQLKKQLKNAFSDANHNEGNLALHWYFRKSFLQVVFSTSVNFFPMWQFSTDLQPFLSKNSLKMHFQGPNTMKETLYCPGILGKASFRQSSGQVYIVSDACHVVIGASRVLTGSP